MSDRAGRLAAERLDVVESGLDPLVRWQGQRRRCGARGCTLRAVSERRLRLSGYVWLCAYHLRLYMRHDAIVARIRSLPQGAATKS